MISYLLLDYNRPKEAKKCIDSLSRSKFPYIVNYLSNGGENGYILDFFREGKIDELILNKENKGCGLGMRQLAQSCKTRYAIFLQVDQFLAADFYEKQLQNLIAILQNEPNVFYIDLAGNQNKGRYSERAGLIDITRYHSIPNMPRGGPGPYQNEKWTENHVAEYVEQNNFLIKGVRLFADNGRLSVRDNADGSCWVYDTYTKENWIKDGRFPTQKGEHPDLTDEEWSLAIAGKWPQHEIDKEGKIPSKWKYLSFN